MLERIEKGLDYVKSIPFVLKITEFVVLLIAFSLAGHFLNTMDSNFFVLYGKKGSIDFFLFVTIVGWLISIVFPILFIFGIQEKFLLENHWTLIVAVVSGVWALLLLTASAVLAMTAKKYDDEDEEVRRSGYFFFTVHSACKLLNKNNSNATCGHLIGGAVFGIIAALLFAGDTIVHAYMYLKGRPGPIPQAALGHNPVIPTASVQPANVQTASFQPAPPPVY
ncbi:uncharacterized protein LOC114517353 [Dendronephthya gigantea]|uniref:uncharacterized protein LOC114517353 n=1 Tax=Dendronephthya gigantea TaxID=151771 RepID=UPI00106B19D6|nr:uncharacterized protein LOC114517353 [Dendronephthya gigantea]